MRTAADAPNPSRFEAVHADASEQIAREIRMYIEREGLRPGDRIGTEHELSREFGVSRPTLREGVRRLAGSHLIRVQKGRAGGVFVDNTRPLSPDDRGHGRQRPAAHVTSWILDVLQPSLIEHLGSTIDGGVIIAQHQAIMRSIRRHQRTGAERAMRQHIQYMSELLSARDASPA